ncbi:MAG: HAMP domain-containing protein [Planctomycetes bacterium]|nr:HAMP domain-containing protein [Planctomycetota bacterium]
MRSLSVRWRMTLWNTSASAVVLLGFGLLVYWLLRDVHYGQLDRRLAGLLREANWPGQPDAEISQGIHDWVRRIEKRRDISAAVHDQRGALVACTQTLAPYADRLGSPRPATAQLHFDTLALDGLGRMRRMTAPIAAGDQSYTVMLLAELEHVDEEMALVVRAIALTAPLALTLAATLGYVVARKSLAPVDQLRVLSNEITAERLDRRIPVTNATDELGLLTQTINAMIARLERSFNEIRRFTGDASHELRTPIAVIRSEAEMGLGSAASLEEARERLSSILDECARLTWITDQLLTLSREDAGVHRGASDRVALRPLVIDAVEMMGPLATAKAQSVLVPSADEVTVYGDAARLRHILYNLLDNAIKYTPREGQIEVALRREGTSAVITVRDNGPGIAAEHLPHVFDRFYRGDKGNSGKQPGAGLGLSIVKSIAEVHGGRVEVDSAVSQGSAFHVYLPLANG